MNEALLEVRFQLRISAEDFQRYYGGQVRQVVVTGLDGQTIRFPANVLRRFITHSGIQGAFVMRYDAHHRFHSIERIS